LTVARSQVDSISARLDKLYEFEREPVTADKLHDGRYFAAMFAGEHVAGTEFVIGALFVQWGAGARDILLGLLLGNLLAVLSWAFLCAPIAVRVRLTLYWYARRIIGPGLTVVYNIVNALLYCCLAAAMIGVSASAVIMALNGIPQLPYVKHPAMTDVYPNSIGWVLVVLMVGAVVVLLAIAGFKKLSQFAAVCSPWMFLIFIVGAVATLPKLGEFHNLADLWNLAQTRVWTGRPGPTGTHLGFWHVTFFAWFCNLAMHVGLSDMAVFRYARHWTYGFYSAFGMYLGHYLAWICAGIMGAVLGNQLNPGQMAYSAAGPAGLLCVLLAGWTTANPTIYRAGLALQIVTPNWPRWLITLVAGAITTVVALFPAIFMKLLDFVAIYGLMLMPIGAIIVTEHWVFPRVGLRPYWADREKLFVNPAALISWAGVLILSFPIEQFTNGRFRCPMDLLGIHLFFRWLPGWLLAAISYLLIARLMLAARARPGEPPEPETSGRSGRDGPAASGPRAPKMDAAVWLAGAAAALSLIACLVIALWVFAGPAAAYEARMATYKTLLMVCTLIYFIGAVYWEVRREQARYES